MEHVWLLNGAASNAAWSIKLLGWVPEWIIEKIRTEQLNLVFCCYNGKPDQLLWWAVFLEEPQNDVVLYVPFLGALDFFRNIRTRPVITSSCVLVLPAVPL